MSPTLQMLWEFNSPNHVPDPLQQKLDRFMVLESQVQEQFGWRFVMDLEAAWDELHEAQLDRAFEQGFLAAFRLWAEVWALGQGA